MISKDQEGGKIDPAEERYESQLRSFLRFQRLQITTWGLYRRGCCVLRGNIELRCCAKADLEL